MESAFDITPLVEKLEARGISPIYFERQENAAWKATLETDKNYLNPEVNILAMLKVIELLKGPLRELWFGCSLREFDIGYECGEEPHYIHNGLTSATVQRIAQMGAGIRITLYGTRSRRENEAAASD